MAIVAIAKMPQKEVVKKTRNKRKARTEVSSSSSSDSESDISEQPQPEKKKQKQKQADEDEVAFNSDSDAPVFTTKKQTAVNPPEKTFEEFYLRQATKEFANDLDKLRAAGDFSNKSLSILISALKQGTACFSEEEKRKIVESK